MSTAGLTQRIESDEGFVPSVATADGTASSRERPFPDPSVLDPSVDISVWVAEPGVYTHRPSAVVESALFVHGEGEFEIDGYGSFEIGQGTLLAIPSETAGRLTVRKAIRALVILPLGEEAG